MLKVLALSFLCAAPGRAQVVRAPAAGAAAAVPRVVMPANSFSLIGGASLDTLSVLPALSSPKLAPVLPGSALPRLARPVRAPRAAVAAGPIAFPITAGRSSQGAAPAIRGPRFKPPAKTLRSLSRSLAPDLRAASPASKVSPARAFGAGHEIMRKILGLFDGAKGDPDSELVDRAARRLLLTLLRHQDDPLAAEAEILALLAEAHTAGVLEPVIQALVRDPRIAPMLPPMPPGAESKYAARLAKVIGAELEGAGMIPGKDPFEKWKARGRRQMGLVNKSAFTPRGPGQPSLFEEAGFIAEMEALTGDRFTDGNSIRALGDGPKAYRERNRLIRGARRSVDLMAWAIYDDKSGAETADLLIAKIKKGVKVRIIVDGQTVEDAGHGRETLARLKAAGAEVVLFHDLKRVYDGMHAKMMIIDRRIAVSGGRNVGDPYLHADPKGHKWRDMDVVYEGPAVTDSLRLFARVFNEQVKAHDLPYKRMRVSRTPVPGPGAARASVSYQRPGRRSKVLLGMLKAISGASGRVNIENAYFITFPSVRQALLEALARGVEVNILTNSAESVDEPIVSVPILESLPELIEAGANVYLKQGDTLHAKFMTVDGIYSNVTSFNLHPRSDRYEHEMSVSALDRGLAAELDAEFAGDLATARRIRRAEDLAIPSSPLSFIVRRYLFNQL